MVLHTRTTLLLLLIAIVSSAVLEARCVEIVPDDEVHCPYHPIPLDHDVVFLDLTDGAIRSVRLGRPEDPSSTVVLDPFFELGWTPGPATVAPDGERLLVRRSKPACPGWTGAPGPGLDCSYGRPTLWLAEHRAGDPANPNDDLWVHTNLTRRLLGRNSEIHGWTTWLHGELALFNAVVFPDFGGWYSGPLTGYDQDANAAQIYAVRFSEGEVAIEPFAPAAMWRDQCLTGRLSAQPSVFPDRCFDGQRLSIVRRCYDEPDLVHGWAWFNTANADGSGAACRPDGPIMQVPVLRVFVAELDEACDPKRDFENLAAVRQPPDERVHRQMGMTPEWGDMLAAISPDGDWVAVATNMGDPDGDVEDNCAGFRLNLTDPADPLSGNALRWTHVCRLGPDLRCAGEAIPVGVEHSPPEATALPSFVPVAGAPDPSLVYTREWGVFGQQSGRDVVRLDFGVSPDAIVPLAFGRNAVAGAPIRRSAGPVRRGARRVPAPQPWSLSGRIAFGECDAFGRSQIVVADADGSNRSALTESPYQSWFPSFSPDGSRIAYVRETPTGSEIWTMDARGDDPQRLTWSGVSIAPEWSPDGERIAYAHGVTGGAFKIHVMDVDGSGNRQLIDTTAAQVDENVPVWSPDGLQIAFTSNRRGRYEIWIAATDGEGLHAITEAYRDDGLNADIEQKVPAWSPDGSLIAYWSGVEADDPRPDLPRDVWVVAPDGNGARSLAPGDDPQWSPDGTLVLHTTILGEPPFLRPGFAVVDPATGIDRPLFDVAACRPLQSSWTADDSGR